MQVRYRASQVRHLRRRPPLSSIGRHIVAELRREGVAAVPLEELPFASNRALLDAMPRARQHLDRLDARASRTLEYGEGFEHCVPINPSTIATQLPEFFMWGLDESLLDIVERCIGLDVAYHGVCIRKELVDGKAVGTRLWHRDAEDLDVIRVLVYLNDVVDDESGPFEYVPRHSSPSYRDFHGVERIDDEQMRRVVPEWRWRRAKGPTGTVVFGAVAKLFHRGKIPLSARKLASFCYTSRHPTDERLCRSYSFEPGIPFVDEPLTDRQRACLWKYQELLPTTASRSVQRRPEMVSARPESQRVFARMPLPVRAPRSPMVTAAVQASFAPSELT
ncbi:hypothetical protein [Sandaracinus amylolyticus]|uniref:Phytanoyl-CoA dioxygenase n=1 Tax=Sandaracinus amylolyticus TaxID=927083 RepID=A0A0F6YPM5_9BACT|nr:hypothetical protein [Sandaracinus amylolyticus]AKF11628.1 hypothetical protein DB32_008777 [Sandaracinus amylolyticus]